MRWVGLGVSDENTELVLSSLARMYAPENSTLQRCGHVDMLVKKPGMLPVSSPPTA
jgi:hypothetical protein